ncbi:MAG: hypothetical protein WB795_22985 [Candidatus Acidiferrales bacterium]
MAVLVSALEGLAFDVQIDPTGGRIPVGRAEGLHRLSNRPLVAGGDCVQLYALEPSLATKCAAAADGEQYLVSFTRGNESKRQVRPWLRATDRFRMDIEGHRCHRECRAGSNWRAIEIAYLESLGADPTSQFIALSQSERHGRKANARILRDRIPFDAEGSILAVQDAVVRRGLTANDCPVTMPLLK